MKDKICLITGATDGIGKETAMAIAGMGAEIVMPCRNLEKGERVKQEITQKTGNPKIKTFLCDLSSLQSVKDCTKEICNSYDRLDVLINNAGFSGFKRRLSQDGIEYTFAVNHLAAFLLTNRLLGLLKNGAPSRIITVSADVHKHGTIRFDDLECKEEYNLIRSYCQSKLANILFTKSLAEKLKNTGVTANCLLPGQATTTLIKDGDPFFNMVYRFSRFLKLKRFSAEYAARTPIYLASSSDVDMVSGECFKNRKRVNTSKESYDMGIAEKLWEVSNKYVESYLQ